MGELFGDARFRYVESLTNTRTDWPFPVRGREPLQQRRECGLVDFGPGGTTIERYQKQGEQK
jgi:hypothetical protein